MTKKIFVIYLLITIFFTGCSISKENKSDSIYNFLIPTDGTIIKEDGLIQMKTTLHSNYFSYVVLQLWTDYPLNHLQNISTTTEGKVSGIYMHKLESDYYVVMLKANSNKRDEAVYARVMLIKGRSYTYSFNVKEFGDKSVVISDFKFKMN